MLAVLDQHVKNKVYADSDQDDVTGRTITIPSPIWFNIPAPGLAPTTSLPRFTAFINAVPLQTSLRLFHLIFPQHSDYDYVKITDGTAGIDTRSSAISIWHFTNPNLRDNADRNRKSCVVVFIPPWLLGEEAMMDFAKSNSRSGLEYDPRVHGVTNYNKSAQTPTQPIPLSKHLWSYLHHLCHTMGTPRFILSTYQSWTFGSFSAGWTQSYVSPMFHAGGHHPTILGMMILWLGSSVGVQDSAELPEVRNDYFLTFFFFLCHILTIEIDSSLNL